MLDSVRGHREFLNIRIGCLWDELNILRGSAILLDGHLLVNVVFVVEETNLGNSIKLNVTRVNTLEFLLRILIIEYWGYFVI